MCPRGRPGGQGCLRGLHLRLIVFSEKKKTKKQARLLCKLFHLTCVVDSILYLLLLQA